MTTARVHSHVNLVLNTEVNNSSCQTDTILINSKLFKITMILKNSCCLRQAHQDFTLIDKTRIISIKSVNHIINKIDNSSKIFTKQMHKNN